MSAQQTESGTGQSSGVVVGNGASRFSTRTQWLTLAGIAVFFIALLTAYGGARIAACPGQRTDTALLKKAVSALDQTKVSQLQPVVTKIQNIKCYDKNPNYLYVVIAYYLNRNDPANAAKVLAALKKNYNSANGFSSLIPDRQYAVSDLQARLDLQTATQSAGVQVLQQGQP